MFDKWTKWLIYNCLKGCWKFFEFNGVVKTGSVNMLVVHFHFNFLRIRCNRNWTIRIAERRANQIQLVSVFNRCATNVFVSNRQYTKVIMYPRFWKHLVYTSGSQEGNILGIFYFYFSIYHLVQYIFSDTKSWILLFYGSSSYW